MNNEPKVKVGIMDGQTEVIGHLEGNFRANASDLVSGRFSGRREGKMIVLADEADHKITRSSSIRLTAQKNSTFELSNVTIGNRFHWERKEDQVYQGDLVLHLRED
ncbi:MAG: hypothetical protein ACXU99_11460, partial [Thermodesulfobacteriota bacterium]